MIACDEIIYVMDIVLTKMTNTEATNVAINCHSNKVRDCYILHNFISNHISTIITIICYHYAKHRSKQSIDPQII